MRAVVDLVWLLVLFVCFLLQCICCVSLDGPHVCDIKADDDDEHVILNHSTKQYVNHLQKYLHLQHINSNILSQPSTGFLSFSHTSIFQTDLLYAGVFTVHCLEHTEEAARWLFNQVFVYFLGSNLEVGGPLILIIFKFDMFEIKRPALLSELIFFSSSHTLLY